MSNQFGVRMRAPKQWRAGGGLISKDVKMAAAIRHEHLASGLKRGQYSSRGLVKSLLAFHPRGVTGRGTWRRRDAHGRFA